MSWFGFLWTGNQNDINRKPIVTNEQIIWQNHLDNTNVINMAHEVKMKNLNKKYEEEKNLSETAYKNNLSKIGLNNNNMYHYYPTCPNTYSNQIYGLKIGNIGVIQSNINNNLNSKIPINPNLSKEERRKLEYEKREQERKQRELERKRREAKNSKLTEEDIKEKERKDKEFLENWEKDYQQRRENFEKNLRSKLKLDEPLDSDYLIKNIDNLPNKDEVMKILQEQKEIERLKMEEKERHEKEIKQIEQEHLENIGKIEENENLRKEQYDIEMQKQKIQFDKELLAHEAKRIEAQKIQQKEFEEIEIKKKEEMKKHKEEMKILMKKHQEVMKAIEKMNKDNNNNFKVLMNNIQKEYKNKRKQYEEKLKEAKKEMK